MHGHIASHFSNTIQKLLLPEKCKLFNWFYFYNKQLTANILAKKGLASPSRCTPCYNHEESIEYLFFNCNSSDAVWNSFRGGYNVKALLENLNNLWSNWRSTHRLTKLCKASNILAAITYWTLWKEHNNKIVRSEARSSKEVARTTLVLVVDWTKTSNKKYLRDSLQNLRNKQLII